jgi:hypothetical protein
MAAAAIVPSASAIPVVIAPTLRERTNAPRASECQATLNQCSVHSEIGQPCSVEALNA